MQVYISVDMEGVAGVATLDQVARGGTGYARAQELMTDEANAAIAGAFDAGATRVLVNDSHGTMDNLLASRLDPRARLLTGLPKVDCMAEGISSHHDVALFVGYHAAAGERGVLAHTFSSHFGQVRLNGEVVSEADVNALQLAVAGVPLGLVTGDDVTCLRSTSRFAGVVVAEVKRAHGWSAADSLSPIRAQKLVQERAAQAVSAAPDLQSPSLPEQLELEVDLPNETATEMAAMIPGVDRIDTRVVRATLTDPAELVGLIVVLYQLSAMGVSARTAIINRR